MVPADDHDPITSSRPSPRLGLRQKRLCMSLPAMFDMGHDVFDEGIRRTLPGHVGDDDQRDGCDESPLNLLHKDHTAMEGRQRLQPRFGYSDGGAVLLEDQVTVEY